jgi:hypothetical protein
MAVTHSLAALSLGRALVREDNRRYRVWSRKSRASIVDESRVYLVEHYGDEIDAGTATALADRLAFAAQARPDDVRLIGSACVPRDEAFLSFVGASSAGAVAAAVAAAGVVPDRIVPVLWLDLQADRNRPS